MPAHLKYIIKFVADMDQAVRFHRDILGFPLSFQSPDWSEFATGETRLALHPASSKNPAGSVQLGLRVADMQAFYTDMTTKGIQFSKAPALEFGAMIARFLDPDGNEWAVSEDR